MLNKIFTKEDDMEKHDECKKVLSNCKNSFLHIKTFIYNQVCKQLG